MNITALSCDAMYSGRLLRKFREDLVPLIFNVLTYKLKMQAADYSETLVTFYRNAGRLIS